MPANTLSLPPLHGCNTGSLLHSGPSHCEAAPGTQEYLPLGRFSAAEEQGFEALKAELQSSIKKGVDFVVSGEPLS